MFKCEPLSLSISNWQLNMSSIKPTISDTSLVSTEKLMQGKSELTIVHNEQHYRLRITRNGKLILTK